MIFYKGNYFLFSLLLALFHLILLEAYQNFGLRIQLNSWLH